MTDHPDNAEPVAQDEETSQPAGAEGAFPSGDGGEDSTLDKTLAGGRDSEIRRRRMTEDAPVQASSELSEESKSAINLMAETLPPDFQQSQSIADNKAGVTAPGDIRMGSRAVSRERGEDGDYEIIGQLGEGGMGVVYRAKQTAVGRVIALKTVKRDQAANPVVRSKFLSEAVVTADLEHPNIVPVYDLGTSEDDACFYAMKHVKGVPWEDVIDERTQEENLETLMRTADAVAFAHSRGVIHRDLKPENVMLGDFGEVLVMDWGLAASVTDSGRATPLKICNAIAGTPTYMAPEMGGGHGEKIGPASDTYLLGGILFRILTGLTPHHGMSVRECLQNAAANVIQSTDVDNELLEIALKAMATEPEDRYSSVKEFQYAVRECQRHHESLVLSNRAKAELAKARESKEYHDFARALFGNEEAILLWEGNSAARKAIRECRLAYAECAFEKGDLDLAESLLQEGGIDDVDLVKEVQRAKRKRAAQEKRAKIAGRVAAGAIQAQSTHANKLKGLQIAAVVQSILLLALGIGAGVMIYRERGKAESAANEAATAVTNANTETLQAMREAEKQKEKAMKQKAEAERQRMLADEARAEAERQKAAAEAALKKAQEVMKQRANGGN